MRLSDPDDRRQLRHKQFKTSMCRRAFLPLLLLFIQFYEYNAGEEEKGLFDFFFLNNKCKCRCGVPNRDARSIGDARLIGGEYLRTYEFPWLALIQIRSQIGIPGTLINDRYIVTSASQLIGLTPYDIKITLGQFDRCFPDVSSQNLSAEAIILNPNFNPGNRANDIALVKLSSPVRLERRIQPICLSVPGSRYIGQVATVVAWAEGPSVGGELPASCRPRKAGLPVLSYTECLGSAYDSQFVSLDKGCIGVLGSPSIVCGTDAGGPVMYRSYNGVYELIGILSDKNDCNQLPSSALYTTINDQLNWIKHTTRDACYCIKT